MLFVATSSPHLEAHMSDPFLLPFSHVSVTADMSKFVIREDVAHLDDDGQIYNSQSSHYVVHTSEGPGLSDPSPEPALAFFDGDHGFTEN
jgi:hypothetical protein